LAVEFYQAQRYLKDTLPSMEQLEAVALESGWVDQEE
jgi:hypothetical protein